MSSTKSTESASSDTEPMARATLASTRAYARFSGRHDASTTPPQPARLDELGGGHLRSSHQGGGSGCDVRHWAKLATTAAYAGVA